MKKTLIVLLLLVAIAGRGQVWDRDRCDTTVKSRVRNGDTDTVTVIISKTYPINGMPGNYGMKYCQWVFVYKKNKFKKSYKQGCYFTK